MQEKRKLKGIVLKNEEYPMVVIVILNYNQGSTTVQCLESLRQIDYPNYKIVLVDNGSKDGSVETLRALFQDILIIRNGRNLGVAGGRNVGIHHAGIHYPFDYLLFLDNDTQVNKTFLTEIVRASQADPTVGLAFPKILYMDAPDVIQYADDLRFNFYTGRHRYHSYKKPDNGQYDLCRYSMLGTGTALLVKNSVISKIGGFDEIFYPYGYEDLDFSLRARKHGFNILYVPSGKILHKESRTPSKGKYNEDYARMKGRHMKIFLKKHASGFQMICLIFFLPITGMHTFIRELRRGNAGAAISLFKSFFSH